MYKKYVKRVMDIVIALIGIILLSPIFLIITMWLFIVNGGKPFFFQSRPGKKEHVFRIVKFKTMTDKVDEKGELLPDVLRITKIGSFVRRSSLDEIPQLFNVLIGDMSIIGPRPLRTYYIPLYNEQQKRRHLVKPGITGWAQINGRNAISWTKKFELDVWYVDNVSFQLDLKILYLTILKVLKPRDINASNETTMERFNGRN